MGNVLVDEQVLKDMANNIRAMTGKTDLMKPSEMASNIKIGKPYVDSSKITDWSSFFSGDKNSWLLEYADFSGGTNFYRTFYNFNATTMLPSLNMSKGELFTQCFYLPSGAGGIEEIQEIIFNNAATSTMKKMFTNLYELKQIKITGTINVDSNDFDISASQLTVESLLSFLNAFADNTGGTTYTVYFGTTNLEKLTAEQQQIATDKNITLA